MMVSVVMCTYNGAGHIKEQLDSIMAQSFPVSEIIIQDDGSDDGTVDIVRDYSEKDTRIKLFINEARLGPNLSFITAIDRAGGDLIAWSDQDDIWRKDKVEKQLEKLVSEDLLACTHYSFSFWEEQDLEHIEYDRRIPNTGLERTLFVGTCPGHTMLFKKELRDMFRRNVSESILNEISKSFIYDTMLSIIANAYGRLGYIHEPLDYHRRLTSSFTYKSKKYTESHSRSLAHAVTMVFRNMKPSVRRQIKPVIQRRFSNMDLLLDCFPDAPESCTTPVRCLTSSFGSLRFPFELIRYRDKVLYSSESGIFISFIQAMLFNITKFDYFK